MFELFHELLKIHLSPNVCSVKKVTKRNSNTLLIVYGTDVTKEH